MNEKELYKLRGTGNSNFNYYFDKITSIFSKFNELPIKNPQKILFIRNDHIGDMVYSTQIFREVKKAFPNAKIYVLATSSNKDIIEKDKNVEGIIEGDQFWRRGLSGFKDYFGVLKKIKKENFDTGIDLRRSKFNMFFYLFIPRIKRRASYYNINGGKAFLTHPAICDGGKIHIKESTGMINKIFGIEIKNYWPEIQTDKEDLKAFEEIVKKNKLKKYMVFSPGATASSKKWPEENFNKLIEIFHKKYPNYKIVLSGANSDRGLVERLCKNRNYCVPLINFNLRKMALVFKNSEAVVANDGCATDISWVAGGKLVTLVGPVNIELSSPQRNTIILHHKLPCYPCNWAEPCKKPCGKWCMDLITPEEVMNAVEKQMKEKR